MARKPDEKYGSTDTETEYDLKGNPRPDHGFARSAWSMAMVAGFFGVLLAVVWVYWPAGRTDPAPGGSSRNAITREPAPAPANP